jgi:hypothetical protein
MSYNTVLDTYFSSFWLGFCGPFVLMFLYLILRKYIRKGRAYTFLERGIVIGVCIVLLLTFGLVNPLYWGYGKPTAIDDIRLAQGKLFVVDHIMTMGSETDSGDECMRVHVLDPATGEKKIRFLVGRSGEWIGVHGDTVAISRYNDVAYFSVTNGKKFVVYSTATLPGLFPELASGINAMTWTSGHLQMEITGMDGKRWTLDTQSGKLSAVVENTVSRPYAPTNLMTFRDKEIQIDNVPGQTQLLELDGEGGNQHQLYLKDTHDTIVNHAEMFLDGKFVGLAEKAGACLILSFESLTQDRYKLACMSLDGKRKLWEIRHRQFNPNYLYPEWFHPHFAVDETMGLVWISIDREILALQLRDGSLKWRVAL